MQIGPPTCDEAALDALLSDRLTDVERIAIERHLEGCSACRANLEHLAADADLWAEASVSLSTAADAAAAGISTFSPQGDTEGLRPDQILRFLSPTDDPRMLGRFGGYEISGLIGYGGMGVVLKGLDVALNRYVAIKVLAPHLATSAAARLRFAREAQAAAAVVHENVVAIHAVSEANGLPYLVMPYIRGKSLQKRVDTYGPLTATEVLRIGRQVAAGLAAAHAQGLVHRDIKPANILLEDGVERLKITDFGLARAADDASLTRSGVIAGTPQFMSPEQARGDSIDGRSDLFSLGSVLYTLCTGHPPFRAETSFGMLRRITDDVPRSIREINPEIPEFLETIIEKLHAKNAADRYATAGDVSQLCEQCLAHLQQPNIVPLPASVRIRPRQPVSAEVIKSRRLVYGSMAVLSIVALVALFVHSNSKENTHNGAASNLDRQVETPPRSPSDVWDDGTDQRILGAGADVDLLESVAEVDWPGFTQPEDSR
jgi:serine/threonine-protein kinase